MEPTSIIVITYNEEQNIRDCLDSLVRLDYPAYEILVVDASSDKTPEIAKSFPSVRVIRSDQPGFARQKNLGVTHAGHELVAFTDADCIVPPNWLNALADNLKGDVAAVGGNAYSPKNSPFLGKCVACLGYPAGGDLGLDAVTRVSKEGYVQTIATCNAVFRKNILNRINGFNETLDWGGEDSEICERITNAGWKIQYAGDSFVYHKTRDSLKSFARWCFRRGRARYHFSKSRLKLLLSLALGAMGILFLAIKPWAALVLGLIVFTGTITAILFTSKFRHLIRHRKKIKIGLESIILVVAPLELSRHIFRLAGETIEALKNRIRITTNRLNPGQMSDI